MPGADRRAAPQAVRHGGLGAGAPAPPFRAAPAALPAPCHTPLSGLEAGQDVGRLAGGVQAAHGLTADGIVGDETWTEVEKLITT